MNVFVVFVLVLVASASALASGALGVTESVVSLATQVPHVNGEPALMLLSGSVLLVLAGALRRLPG